MSWQDAIQNSINALAEGHQAIFEHLNHIQEQCEASLEGSKAVKEIVDGLIALSRAQSAKTMVLEIVTTTLLAGQCRENADPKMALAAKLIEAEGVMDKALTQIAFEGGFDHDLRVAMDSLITNAEELL